MMFFNVWFLKYSVLRKFCISVSPLPKLFLLFSLLRFFSLEVAKKHMPYTVDTGEENCCHDTTFIPENTCLYRFLWLQFKERTI